MKATVLKSFTGDISGNIGETVDIADQKTFDDLCHAG
jgi:hypothetical protein